MNQPNPQTQNPYAPTVNVAEPVRTQVTTIPLVQGEIRFAGQLTKRDVRRAFSKRIWLRWSSMLFLIPILLLGFSALAGAPVGVMEVSSLVGVPALFLTLELLNNSGWLRAREAMRSNSKMLTPREGSLTATHLIYKTPNGWTRLSWSSFAGVRITDGAVVLAIDSLHKRLIILTERFFVAEDWPTVQTALGSLATQLPFKRGANQAAEALKMATGEVEELEVVFPDLPSQRIMLDGVATVGDVLKTAHGYRLIASNLIWLALIGTIGILLQWGVQFQGWYLLLMVTFFGCFLFILAVRTIVLLFSMIYRSEQVLLKYKCVIGDEGIWGSTPHAVAFWRWSEFNVAAFSPHSILLKASHNDFTFIVLSRRALVDPADWEPLQSLVRKKVLGKS